MSTLNQINQTIGRHRWTICALLFFATTVNYMDRQVLSLLKEDLAATFNWSETDYGDITSAFTFVYAL
jgi:ACS family hexuronate transporter-like MFS transporter